MRFLGALIGAVVGWLVVSVTAGFALGWMTVQTGVGPELERYGVGIAALLGIVVGWMVGYRAAAELWPAPVRRATVAPSSLAMPAIRAPQTLKERLDELNGLRATGDLTEEEFRDLRERVLRTHPS